MIRAFILGMVEFRSDFTSYFEGRYLLAYDRGRELMHRLTLRRFDP